MRSRAHHRLSPDRVTTAGVPPLERAPGFVFCRARPDDLETSLTTIDSEPRHTLRQLDSFSGLRTLRSGARLDDTDTQPLWRVRRGLMAISARDDGEGERTHVLAVPGDLLGVAALAGEAVALRARALTAVAGEPLACADRPLQPDLLRQAYAQSRRQGREILRLRTGMVADRVRQMLLLLGEHAGTDDAEVELPSLRRLAELLDASPEAICRVLGRMRQLDVLVTHRPRAARLSTRALNELVLPQGMSSSLPAQRTEPCPAP